MIDLITYLYIALIVIGILAAVFLITRHFWCWYWKINERIDLFKDIQGKLKYMIQLLEEQKEPEKIEQKDDPEKKEVNE